MAVNQERPLSKKKSHPVYFLKEKNVLNYFFTGKKKKVPVIHHTTFYPRDLHDRLDLMPTRQPEQSFDR
jgi:hypothetical protein